MSGPFNTAELDALAKYISSATDGLMSDFKPVMAKAGVNMKKQLREEAQGTRYPRLPYSIGYDTTTNQKSISVEVGPKHEGTGNLANIMYFGGSHGGGGTLPDPIGALEAEAPKATDALLDIVEKALRG